MNNVHLIAAEGILAIIDCIARKFTDSESVSGRKRKGKGPPNVNAEYADIQREQKRKRSLKKAAKTFNDKLTKSLPLLQSMGALKTPLDSQDIATFLHQNPYIDQIKIGEFLGLLFLCDAMMTTLKIH